MEPAIRKYICKCERMSNLMPKLRMHIYVYSDELVGIRVARKKYHKTIRLSFLLDTLLIVTDYDERIVYSWCLNYVCEFQENDLLWVLKTLI